MHHLTSWPPAGYTILITERAAGAVVSRAYSALQTATGWVGSPRRGHDAALGDARLHTAVQLALRISGPSITRQVLRGASDRGTTGARRGDHNGSAGVTVVPLLNFLLHGAYITSIVEDVHGDVAMSAEGLELGRRVWVADALQPEGRAFGLIASLPQVFLDGCASFVVMLDGGTPTVVTCCVERRGGQWDFADESEASYGGPGVSGAASVAAESSRP